MTFVFFLFQDAIDDPTADGEDCLPVDEIPGSIELWEVSPRPPNSRDVNYFLININLRCFDEFSFSF